MANWMLIMTAKSRAVRGESNRCYLARLVHRADHEDRLLGWRLRGRSLSLLLRGDRPSAVELGRRVAIGTAQSLRAAFHCRSLEQAARDALDGLLEPQPGDPLDTASSLPDLLGHRRLDPGLRARVRAVLGPLPATARPPAGVIHDWSPLEEAAAAVFGHIDLRRRWLWRPQAIAAATHLAPLGTTATARLLRVSPATVRRARARRPRAAVVFAIEGQLLRRQQPTQLRLTVTRRPSRWS